MPAEAGGTEGGRSGLDVVRVAILICLAVGWANASVIVATVPQYDGPVHGPADPYPLPAVTVGTFGFSIPGGESIVSANLVGQWGDFNGLLNSTAPVELFLVGENVATCTSSDLCFTTALIPWSFNFSSGDFATIAAGALPFTQVQTGASQVHLSQTTLTITTAPTAVPEAGAGWLVAAGLGLIALRRGRAGRPGSLSTAR